MNHIVRLLLVVALLTGSAGCAGTDRQPQCHGPWTPINTAQQGRAHG